MRFNSLRILLLISALGLACTKSTTTAEVRNSNESPSPVATVAQNQPGGDQELEQRLKIICDRAQGTVGLSVVGSARDLVKLLVQLHEGKILQPANQKLLIGFMERSLPGWNRLRGDLPRGTVVADKTGSGEKDAVKKVAKSTNDVGIITLPSGRGHLAMAVLVSGSKLPDADQEKVITDIARAAFDAYSAINAEGVR